VEWLQEVAVTFFFFILVFTLICGPPKIILPRAPQSVRPGLDVPHCIGQWLPFNKAAMDDWLQKHIEKVDGLVADGIPDKEKGKSPHNYHQMLQLMSHLLTKAPEFSPKVSPCLFPCLPY